MSNKPTHIVISDTEIQEIPKMEMPGGRYLSHAEQLNEINEWYEYLTTLPKIKRADNGVWKIGQELTEGVDFKIDEFDYHTPGSGCEDEDLEGTDVVATPIAAQPTQPLSAEHFVKEYFSLLTTDADKLDRIMLHLSAQHISNLLKEYAQQLQPTPIAEQDFKNKVAVIMRDNITFAPQLHDYIIHGALDKIWQLHLSTTPIEGVEMKASESQSSNDYELREKYEQWVDTFLAKAYDAKKDSYRKWEELANELVDYLVSVQQPLSSSVASHTSAEGNSVEKIRQELEKIATLKNYSVHASQDSFQVYDKRTDELIIDADFESNMIDNIIDGLFAQGSLYEYLLNKDHHSQ